MCKGTACQHEKDPAVLYLEEPYGSWAYTEKLLYSGEEPGQHRGEPEPDTYVVRVAGRNMFNGPDEPHPGDVLNLGPVYDQPMIRLKDDLASYKYTSEEEGDRYAAFLLHCRDCGSQSHVCARCQEPITHMAQGYCMACVERYWTEEDSPIPRDI